MFLQARAMKIRVDINQTRSIEPVPGYFDKKLG